MATKLRFGGVEFTGDVQCEPLGAHRAESESVRIGVIGDLRGRALAARSSQARSSLTGCAFGSTVTTSMPSWAGSMSNVAVCSARCRIHAGRLDFPSTRRLPP